MPPRAAHPLAPAPANLLDPLLVATLTLFILFSPLFHPRHRQAELVHCRWAMLGVAGILVQEVSCKEREFGGLRGGCITPYPRTPYPFRLSAHPLNPYHLINLDHVQIVKPDIFFYNAALPENIPNSLFFGGPTGKLNYGGLLAWEFLLMHFVEVRRWMDVKKHGSVNDDPIFKGNRVPNPEPGYPGGPFDPLGFSKGDFKSLQTKVRKSNVKSGEANAAWVESAMTVLSLLSLLSLTSLPLSSSPPTGDQERAPGNGRVHGLCDRRPGDWQGPSGRVEGPPLFPLLLQLDQEHWRLPHPDVRGR